MNDLREKIAALQHEQWTGWMEYLFSKCQRGTSGRLIMPIEVEERWRRQIATPYAELPENERDSDRVEADKVIATLESTLQHFKRIVIAAGVEGGAYLPTENISQADYDSVPEKIKHA